MLRSVLAAAALAAFALPALAQPAADPLANLLDEDFGPAFCIIATQTAEAINGDIARRGDVNPMMANENIRIETVDLDCAAQTMLIVQVSTDPRSAATEEWIAGQTTLWSAPYCGQQMFLRAIALGWKFTRQVTFADGEVLVIEPVCEG